MKGFYIEITNNLLDPKHREAMKESVWLFMWFLDKMTSIDEKGIGKILGGKPIKYKEVKDDLGISIRTYRRWIDQLKENGYINILRTPYGCGITVNKARKRFGRSVNGGTSRYAKSGTSPTKSGTSNKTYQYDINSKDINKDKYNNKIIKNLKKELASTLSFKKI